MYPMSLSKNRHIPQYQPTVMISHVWLLMTTLYLQGKGLIIYPFLVHEVKVCKIKYNAGRAWKHFMSRWTKL